MNIESRIWGTTRTGTKVHAFGEDGTALCRSSVISNPGGTWIDHAAARRWVLGSPGLSFCTTCEGKFQARIDATPAPVEKPDCTCPDYEPPAKYGHHVVCPLSDTDNKESDDMASETTTRTGPLTELQRSILTGLMQGKSNIRVGVEHGKSRTHVANIISAAVDKMGCETSRQAIAMLATHNAYLEAAALIEADAAGLRSNNSVSDDYVAACLADLADILRSRAAKLIPS
jgi:DNA-binding CsgD family transcriptional regulator